MHGERRRGEGGVRLGKRVFVHVVIGFDHALGVVNVDEGERVIGIVRSARRELEPRAPPAVVLVAYTIIVCRAIVEAAYGRRVFFRLLGAVGGNESKIEMRLRFGHLLGASRRLGDNMLKRGIGRNLHRATGDVRARIPPEVALGLGAAAQGHGHLGGQKPVVHRRLRRRRSAVEGDGCALTVDFVVGEVRIAEHGARNVVDKRAHTRQETRTQILVYEPFDHAADLGVIEAEQIERALKIAIVGCRVDNGLPNAGKRDARVYGGVGEHAVDDGKGVVDQQIDKILDNRASLDVVECSFDPRGRVLVTSVVTG